MKQKHLIVDLDNAACMHAFQIFHTSGLSRSLCVVLSIQSSHKNTHTHSFSHNCWPLIKVMFTIPFGQRNALSVLALKSCCFGVVSIDVRTLWIVLQQMIFGRNKESCAHAQPRHGDQQSRHLENVSAQLDEGHLSRLRWFAMALNMLPYLPALTKGSVNSP